MSRVLVLRDREAAAETARELAARGHEALVLPVQEIATTDAPPPPGEHACTVVTSRNAVPALRRHLDPDGSETIAVGEATAARLRAAGYRVAHVGGGAARHLLRPAMALSGRAGRPVLLVLGRPRRSVLERGLARAGVPFAVWESYEARPLRPSPAAVEAALGGQAPDAVLILSAAQADGFARLLADHPALFRPLPRLVCLSERIRLALPAELRAAALISPSRDRRALFERIA